MGKLSSASPLPSSAHASGEGIDGPVILDQQIKSILSSKDDAQVLSTSRMLQSCRLIFVLIYPIIATDTKSGVPNDSTYPANDLFLARLHHRLDEANS